MPVYLYGFVPAGVRLPPGGLLGVGDVPVELLPVDGFAAAIGRPADDEYGEEPLESRAGDLEWMAEQGLRHEQVVAWFVDHASIVPSRLLTLFSSDDALRAATAGDAARIRDDLARFAGAREWDLKVAYDPVRMDERLGELSGEIGRLDREIEHATPGKRFLLERKRKDLARVEARATARRLAGELMEALRPIADDVVLLPNPAADTPVVLNAALLVPSGREATLRDRAAAERERLEPLGVSVGFTGPWAPYRFVGGGND